jgi:hypothetical protein
VQFVGYHFTVPEIIIIASSGSVQVTTREEDQITATIYHNERSLSGCLPHHTRSLPKLRIAPTKCLLYPNDERASLYLSNNHDIFITPLDSAAVSSSNEVEEMCLVKIYCDTNSSAIPITSYWEPRTTTKSLASALYRFYRKAFQTYAWTQIDDPLVVWTVMKYFGDSKVRGRPRNHWESIASFFNRQNATGVLNSEPVWDKADSDEQETRSYGETITPCSTRRTYTDHSEQTSNH